MSVRMWGGRGIKRADSIYKASILLDEGAGDCLCWPLEAIAEVDAEKKHDQIDEHNAHESIKEALASRARLPRQPSL